MKKFLIFAAICFCAFQVMADKVLVNKSDDFQSIMLNSAHSSGPLLLVGGNVTYDGTDSSWEVDQRRIGITAVSVKYYDNY